MKIKPITPQELDAEFTLPDYILKGVNALLKEEYRGKGTITLKQKDVVKKIISFAPTTITKNELFEKKYLDFEPIYRKAGWSVTYESPSYGDSDFEPYYNFTKK